VAPTGGTRKETGEGEEEEEEEEEEKEEGGRKEGILEFPGGRKRGEFFTGFFRIAFPIGKYSNGAVRKEENRNGNTRQSNLFIACK